MNSSEAFQFVTIEQSESRLEDSGTKCAWFLVFPFVCSLPLLSRSSLFLFKFGSTNPNSRHTCYTCWVISGSETVALSWNGASGADPISPGISRCSWNGVVFVILSVSPEEASPCALKAATMRGSWLKAEHLGSSGCRSWSTKKWPNILWTEIINLILISKLMDSMGCGMLYLQPWGFLVLHSQRGASKTSQHLSLQKI